MIADRRVEAKRLWVCRREGSRRHAVAAGKQGHIVTHSHQRIRQIGDNALGAAVEFRRNGFHQRRNLPDPHCPSGFVSRLTPRQEVRFTARGISTPIYRPTRLKAPTVS